MNRHTFSQLKTMGKNTLMGNYWYSIGIILLAYAVIYAAEMIVSFIFMTPLSVIMTMMTSALYNSADTDILFCLIHTFVMFILILVMISLTVFIANPLMIGVIKFFINLNTGTHNIKDLMFIFKNHFLNTALITFFKVLYTFLWSLLLIVPGIIKTYQYSMIEYILAENPSLDRKRAFEITKALTMGNKWRIFCFGLSFIGWILLSYFTCGIGLIFLMPYVQASFVQLYYDLKAQAIADGRVREEDFIYNYNF